MFGIPVPNMTRKELEAALGWLYEEYQREAAERHRLSATQFDWARPTSKIEGKP